MIEIVKLTENVVIINKPAGVPSQADTSADMDAMALTAEALSAMGESPALWLVHRLDRVVGGLIVFARSREYAAILSEAVSSAEHSKIYLAVVEGRAVRANYTDYLYKDARLGKSLVVKRDRAGAKMARLGVLPIAEHGEGLSLRSLVAVRLYTGRFHQIRAQLSAHGTPIAGDKKYGGKDRAATSVALFSHALSFSLCGEELSVSHLPPYSEYPWSLFDGACYDSIDAVLNREGEGI